MPEYCVMCGVNINAGNLPYYNPATGRMEPAYTPFPDCKHEVVEDAITKVRRVREKLY